MPLSVVPEAFIVWCRLPSLLALPVTFRFRVSPLSLFAEPETFIRFLELTEAFEVRCVELTELGGETGAAGVVSATMLLLAAKASFWFFCSINFLNFSLRERAGAVSPALLHSLLGPATGTLLWAVLSLLPFFCCC